MPSAIWYYLQKKINCIYAHFHNKISLIYQGLKLDFQTIQELTWETQCVDLSVMRSIPSDAWGDYSPRSNRQQLSADVCINKDQIDEMD